MSETEIVYILTDIEGTTSDIKFVKEVLFPYAARELPKFIRERYADIEVSAQIQAVAEEIDCTEDDLESIISTLLSWIKADLKKTSLKALQGQVWRSGYVEGDFTGHLYDDAYQRLSGWVKSGLKLGVYSSGSVAAQRLLFGYSDFGDLTSLFSDYFDTQVGHKRERVSYANIVETLVARERVSTASEVLFLSDVAAELDAAQAVGMKTAELRRDGAEPSGQHPHFSDFNMLAAYFSL